MPEEVGFIGLGAMGLPIARNLLSDGVALTVYNRTAAKADPLREAGATVVDRPSDAARPGGVVVSMVADDAALEKVTTGAGGLLDRLAPGGVHVSMSTIAPLTAERLAAVHADHGCAYVAAPVFGRPDAAAARKLTVLLAGPADARERVRPLLEPLAAKTVALGEEAQSANAVKLAGNFLIMSALESMAEAFALAEKYGVSRETVAGLLADPAWVGNIYGNYGAAIAAHRYQPVGFRLTLGHKDARLALEAGARVGVPMPLGIVIRDRLAAAAEAGLADLDWSALALAAAKEAGLSPEAPPASE